MTHKLDINLPFPGFYHSHLSEELDSVAESAAENYAERQGEEGVPPELRLSAEEFAEILFDVMNYSVAEEYIAREWVSAFEAYVQRELGVTLGLTFDEMVSPREYNFTTDRVFAKVNPQAIRKLWKLSKADKHERLAEVIKDRFTSYDGFASFYSNSLDAWLSKPVIKWDHNELGTLLLAVLPETDERDFYSSLTGQLYEMLSEAGDFYSAHDEAVDWAKFDAKAAELRADKEAEYRELIDPDYVPPAPRCPYTADLFKA